ncbi:MAG: alpha/beta hydrolase-fold protein [Steroidobacterales bacterium]
MHTIFESARAGSVAPVRMLMLPAAYTGPDDFVREGFAAAVRGRGIDLDLVFAQPAPAHLTDPSVVEQLHRHIIQPARALGVDLWLGGISLGGFIALRCAAQHPQDIAGLCLFAPYLGSHIMTGEIARAGGAHFWESGDTAADDDERQVWRFIKTRDSGALPIYMGSGREDRFADRHALLAAALPAENVEWISGAHDWPTWRRLWIGFLDRRFAVR